MNWTGGARYRIKTHGERKIQKEFFDRKRFGALKAAGGRAGNKRGVSQDLLALHTVNRAHSHNKQDGAQKQKSIKSIDLDKFQSCTRSIEEVDLGPASPNPAASRLLLMEPKSDPNQSGSIQGSHIFKRDTKSVEFTPNNSSFDSFLKPVSVHNHPVRSGNSGQHTPTTSGVKRGSMGDVIRKDDTIEKNENSTSRLPPFSFQKRSKKSQSAFDPFAAEDFQITPLRKYSKQETPMAQDYDSKRKREHSMFDKQESNEKYPKRVHRDRHSRQQESYSTSTPLKETDNLQSKEKYSKQAHIDRQGRKQDSYSTSTPLKDTDKLKHHHKHHKSKHKFDFSFLNSSVSPIEKLPKLNKHHVPELEDDFTYKPRPMVNTPEGSLIRKQTPVFNTSSFITSPVEIKPVHEALKSSDSSYPWEKTNFGKWSGTFDTESILSRHESAEAARSHSFLESAEKSNVFLRNSTENPVDTIFSQEVTDDSRSSPQEADIVSVTGNNSSLSRYRQKLLEEENEINSPTPQTKDSQNISQCNAVKSDNLFEAGDFKDDFEYKPHRITPPTEDKDVDIMKMYQKHKETSDTDGGVLLNQMTVPYRRNGVDFGAKLSGESDVKARRLSGGEAVNFTRSPRVAMEYPVHLLRQSAGSFTDFANKQTSDIRNSPEFDEWSTPGMNKPRIRRETRSHTNSHMEEVLQEMKELEQQDSAVVEHTIQQDMQEDSCNNVAQPMSQQEISTEHMEVDHFLDSEQKFWATVPTVDDKKVIEEVPVDTTMQDNQRNETVDETSNQRNETVSDAVISKSQSKHLLEPVETQINGIINEEENKIIDDFESKIVEQYYLSSITIITDNNRVDANISPASKTSNVELDASFSKQTVNESPVLRNVDKAKTSEIVHCGERMDQHPTGVSQVQVTNEIKFPKELNFKSDLDSGQKQDIGAMTSTCVDNKDVTPIDSSEKRLTENKTKPRTEDRNNVFNTLSSTQMTANSVPAEACNVSTKGLPLNETPITMITIGPIQAGVENVKTFMPPLFMQPQTEKQLTENNIKLSQSFEEIGIKPDSPVSRMETNKSENCLNKDERSNNEICTDNSNIENDICFKTESMKETSSKYFSSVKTETDKAVKNDKLVIQDPQVSSGCNQGTQTDNVPCIDVASSPFVGQHSPISTKSIGIQCKFELADKETAAILESKVPKLGKLASSFIGSGYRKSMTLMSYLSKNLGQSSSQQSETEVISTNENEIDASMKTKDNAEEDVESFATADSMADEVDSQI